MSTMLYHNICLVLLFMYFVQQYTRYVYLKPFLCKKKLLIITLVSDDEQLKIMLATLHTYSILQLPVY